MVVASRCFTFRALITQEQIGKRFQVQNSTSLLYLLIPSSAETWKIVTKKVCQFFFCFSWHFKREKSVFWKEAFLQNKNWLREQDFVYKTLRLVRISLLISTITKSLRFFSGKLFYKSNKKLFSCVCIAWYKQSRRDWENPRQLRKPSSSSRVWILPTPLVFISGYANAENVFYCLAMGLSSRPGGWDFPGLLEIWSLAI